MKGTGLVKLIAGSVHGKVNLKNGQNEILLTGYGTPVYLAALV